ncbi:MAG: hypothetical protein QNJ30_23570 [Kiloniellales bacterium]|nr:hypothetical protein [Kiloniellales bacterium]
MGIEIAVCGMEELPRVAPDFGPTHAVTLLDPTNSRPPIAGLDEADHLFVGVHDISAPRPDHEHPQDHHVEALLAFGESLRPAVESSEVRVLVHCWAGVSRSTAAAFALTCQLTGMAERDALLSIQSLRRQMWPNELIVALADEALDRRGRMRRALEDWRRNQEMPAGYAAWLGR